MKKPSAPIVLLCIVAFLAPIIGGQINTEATMLDPSIGSLLRSIFSGFDSIISSYYSAYQSGIVIDTPTLSHALLAFTLCVAVILTLTKRQVFQVPFLRVSIPLVAFMVWLICTLAFSSVVSHSLVILSEWLTYGIAFYAVIATAGRRRGSQAVLMALVLGCALVAFKGLSEYGQQHALNNPSWRVFSTWQNPTSLAGMLAIGLMLALGLAISDDKVTSVLPWTCGLAMACCIMVTDSRGGIFSMLAGIVCLCGFVFFWAPKDQARLGFVKVASVLLLALIFGRWAHPTSATTHTTVSRAQSPYVLAGQVSQTPAAPGQAVEQSSEFRFLLWRGAITLIKENVLGYGIGNYKNESARPGLTTETQLTHDTYLQVGVEAGVLGFILFLGFLGAWLLEVVRGCYLPLRPISFLRVAVITVAAFCLFEFVAIVSHVQLFPTAKFTAAASLGIGLVWLYVEFFRKTPNLEGHQNIFRAAIIAAIVSMLFDNVLESGLYSFGIGLCTFIILGLGLIQAADGIAPEFMPKPMRAVAAISAFLIAIILLHAGAVETLRARARYELGNATRFPLDSPDAQASIQNAKLIADKALNLAPLGLDQYDGENWLIAADSEDSLFKRAEDLKQAALYEPNTRNLRAVGMTMMLEKDYTSAVMYFNKALDVDPNSLLTLPQLRDAYVANGELDKALEINQRLIDVEKTTYFQVRSLPELIPVETYQARAFLAEHTTDLNKRAELLEQALGGYQQYLQTTIPVLTAMAKEDPNIQYGGETVPLAQYKMQTAAQYAKELADTYRQLKRPADEQRALQRQSAFLQVAGSPSA